MQKDTFILYAKYNQAANEKMSETIRMLSAEEWDKPIGGYFNSIRGICSHIYICDFNWLKLFSKLRNFEVLSEAYFTGRKYSIQEILFEDMNEYLESRPILDEKIIKLMDELVYGDLNTILNYTDSNKTASKAIFGGLLMQLFNHDTHHRGMISFGLELLGHKNNFSSFGAVLNDEQIRFT